jgi:CAAX prenyl protease-like protein
MQNDQSPTPPPAPRDGTWVDRVVAASPQMPYVAPFMTFLLLMWIGGYLGDDLFPWAYALRTFGALAVALVFWKHFPPLGKPHLFWAVVFGLVVAFGWVAIHKWFAAQSWYESTQWLGKDAKPGSEGWYDPYDRLGTGLALWLFLFVRIGGAAIVVPIVEELFWRGFVLRVLINWNRFETIALGTFTWTSFIGCSLLSAAEHPMWEVGILCWVVYNLLFYWKKSLLFLMVTHGVTNLALYVYVVAARDWVFW